VVRNELASMKYTLKICCLIIILIGCGERNIETPANSPNSNYQSEETKSNNFPINEIIKNSIKRKLKYDLDYGFDENTKLIAPDFFKTYLANYSIRNIKDFKLEYDKYSRYYFFDFVEFDKFISFTIIHDDEVGYDNYYNYTYDKESDRITDVVMIALVGGDGGHNQEEFLYYSKSRKVLLVKTKSVYDEDLFDEQYINCYTRLTDIYETKYKFAQRNTEIIDGKMKNTKDTLCQ
jgi:hypothetical protein